MLAQTGQVKNYFWNYSTSKNPMPNIVWPEAGKEIPYTITITDSEGVVVSQHQGCIQIVNHL